MRCNDFDTFIDEMLCGVLHPDASRHMRECERCNSYFRARAAVQNGLRKLASAALPGPSSATDRAVMDSYRLLQQRRSAGNSGSPSVTQAASSARLITFSSRRLAPTRLKWWGGAAAAAMVFAVLGSTVHRWNGVPRDGVSAVNAPIAANAPVAPALQQQLPAVAPHQTLAAVVSTEARLPARARLVKARTGALRSGLSVLEIATAGFRPEPPALPAHGSPALGAASYEASTRDSKGEMQLPSSIAPMIHLASAGTSGSMAVPASSTWPGYSNLMYCDPVVCSGPMQVVHIKVPVGQVKQSLGESGGNGYVNAEVVVGPDGVARAIRVAN